MLVCCILLVCCDESPFTLRYIATGGPLDWLQSRYCNPCLLGVLAGWDYNHTLNKQTNSTCPMKFEGCKEHIIMDVSMEILLHNYSGFLIVRKITFGVLLLCQ